MTPASDTVPTMPLTSGPDAALMFPTLSPAQLARVASRGVTRSTTPGEVLVEPGDTDVPFFVLIEGRLEVTRPSDEGDLLIAAHRPGQFTGEASMLLGRPALMCVRAGESSEVVQLTRDQMHALVQTDTDVGTLLMNVLIRRRLALVDQGLGDVLLVGSLHSADTLRIRAFLTRNGHPFKYVDIDDTPDVRTLLAGFGVVPGDIPIVICRNDVVLKNPDNRLIAAHLRFNERIDLRRIRDVVIIGAGPAGLAAALYAASEGLDALVVEADAPGGQAASSSRIENFLGFPAGLTGQELADRAYAQVQKFGASVLIANGAAALDGERTPYGVRLDEGIALPARTVVVATGARYRRPYLPALARFENAGVYYNATFTEAAQVSDADEVVVVGGANSAGQAAVFLAQKAKRVHMLIRAGSRPARMSQYLLRRIENEERIQVRMHTELVALGGHDQLEWVDWNDGAGIVTRHEIKHVFLMTGADPNTGWLGDRVALCPKGFVKTGPDLTQDELAAARWPLDRMPYLLETSLPGVFAVGDVRYGNIRRVASAVGEGSIVMSFVNRVLAR